MRCSRRSWSTAPPVALAGRCGSGGFRIGRVRAGAAAGKPPGPGSIHRCEAGRPGCARDVRLRPGLERYTPAWPIMLQAPGRYEGVGQGLDGSGRAVSGRARVAPGEPNECTERDGVLVQAVLDQLVRVNGERGASGDGCIQMLFTGTNRAGDGSPNTSHFTSCSPRVWPSPCPGTGDTSLFRSRPRSSPPLARREILRAMHPVDPPSVDGTVAGPVTEFESSCAKRGHNEQNFGDIPVVHGRHRQLGAADCASDCCLLPAHFHIGLRSEHRDTHQYQIGYVYILGTRHKKSASTTAALLQAGSMRGVFRPMAFVLGVLHCGPPGVLD